jgi:hypothetical protein
VENHHAEKNVEQRSLRVTGGQAIRLGVRHTVIINAGCVCEFTAPDLFCAIKTTTLTRSNIDTVILDKLEAAEEDERTSQTAAQPPTCA